MLSNIGGKSPLFTAPNHWKFASVLFFSTIRFVSDHSQDLQGTVVPDFASMSNEVKSIGQCSEGSLLMVRWG